MAHTSASVSLDLISSLPEAVAGLSLKEDLETTTMMMVVMMMMMMTMMKLISSGNSYSRNLALSQQKRHNAT
nr:hypothetical protein BaRGS_021568 [Batillaria attramentaria]